MKLPRTLTGAQLIQHLCRRWNYRKVNQVGSHVILVSDEPTHHRLPVPLHNPLGIGLLKTILREVSAVKKVSQDELLEGL